MVSVELYDLLLEFRQWFIWNVSYGRKPPGYQETIADYKKRIKDLIAIEIANNSEPEVLGEIYAEIPQTEIQQVYDIISNNGQLLEFNYYNPVLSLSRELRFKSTVTEAAALLQHKAVDENGIAYPMSIHRTTVVNTGSNMSSFSKLMLFCNDAYYMECKILLPILLGNFEVVLFMSDTHDDISDTSTVPKLIITQVEDAGVVTRSYRLIDSTSDQTIVKTDGDISTSLTIGIGYDSITDVCTIYTPFGDVVGGGLLSQDLYLYTNNCSRAILSIYDELLDFQYFDSAKELLYSPIVTVPHTSTLGEI